MLTRLKLRIFSSAHEECNEIETIIFEAKKDFKNQIEKEIIMQLFNKSISAYMATCYWPVSDERHYQHQELLSLIKRAPDAQSAVNVLNQSITHIEQQHIATSFVPIYLSINEKVAWLYICKKLHKKYLIN